MKRVKPHHDDFSGTYARTTHGIKACNATESVAISIHKPPMSRRFFYALMRWGWALVLAVLAALALSGCDNSTAASRKEADRQDAEALSSREFAGQAVCGPHATAVWVDDKTLECLRHRQLANGAGQ